MLIYFYEADGVTPYSNTRHEMVGGTQENPVLEYVAEHMVCMCPGRKVGDVFSLTSNGGYSRNRWEVFEFGKAKKVYDK